MTNRPNSIRLVRVRQNNLKNVTVEFPAKQLSVVTGLSGSGKSSLVFDSLYAEGQRRYIESLSTYTRQFLAKMPKPDLDAVENIPPAIALEQRNHVVNSRSTVGTQTEIVDYLRILYAKVGRTSCVDCGGVVQKLDPQSILDWAVQWLPGRKALIVAPLQLNPKLEPSVKKTKSSAKKKAASKKAPKKSTAPSEAAISIESLIPVLKEQGFRRILVQKSKAGKIGESLVLDLEDELPADLRLGVGSSDAVLQVSVVVDRIRLSSDVDRDVRARLFDSIEQSLRIGKGKLSFFDMDREMESKAFDLEYSCIQCGRAHLLPDPDLFSFNSPRGACDRCSGFGHTLELAESLVVPYPNKTLKNGAIDPFSKPSFSEWQNNLFRFAERHGISIGKRYLELTAEQKALLWEGDPEDRTFPGIRACFVELGRWKYKLHIRVFIRRYQIQSLCPKCRGARLNLEALAVKVGGLNIAQALGSSVDQAYLWIQRTQFTDQQRKIAREVLGQVQRRLEFMKEVGVGYLTLDRQAKTLSGGEFQRITLATQLGNGLCGTLYVLDEPSIGLHAADTEKLIGILKRLRDLGNTVVVVEHDLEVMKAADWLIELGPGAGRKGGDLVVQGGAEVLAKHATSLTGKYLSGAFKLLRDRRARGVAPKQLQFFGCREHNLKNLDCSIPLERLVVVTGVSGSGKTTLVHKTIYRALAKVFYDSVEEIGEHSKMTGAESVGGVVLMDQSPIGKSSRSNPATYLKAWDEVRRIFANQVLAHRKGLGPQHFSFNVDGGRCPTCKGEGEITLDMHFMAEVKLPCEECDGRRFKKNVLEVTYQGKNVYQILQTTIDEAFEIFRDNPILARKFGILRDVGLGYLQVGQSATTLSGGESQRLKIALALEDRTRGQVLYIFDEPTTGLHLEDIRKLMSVIQDLVESGNSVLMIEHQMDVIAQADWVLDLGPEGGVNGGQLMGEGSPSDLAENPNSVTGRLLKSHGHLSGVATS